MTHLGRIIWVAGAALLAGCAVDGAGDLTGTPAKQSSPSSDPSFPPIDGNDKYFDPGPPLATPDDVELDKRFVYHQNVIDTHQYSYSIRKSDPTHLELVSLAGFALPADVGDEKPQQAPEAYDIQLPDHWDSREHGVGIPPVRSQGSCGSCWAFGTVGVVEAAIAVYDKQIVDLSEQFVLNCSGKGSCGGGYWAYTAFTKQGGVWEKDYPYTAHDQYCKNVPEHPYKIESFHSIQTGDISAMKAAILQHGSVGVTMSVCGSFPGYGGGIYDSNECNYYSTNHIVTLVGWNDTVQHKSGKGVWILRNSWGSNWGDNGYALIAYGKARIEENPTYVIYKPEDPTDTDGDGVTDLHDNCKDTLNADQKDTDHDGKGDACDDHFDPFEEKLSLTDDDSRKLSLGFSFPFYDTSYPEVYVNADGNLSFGAGDNASVPRDKSRFLTGAPRIAALYADLNPAAGGSVSWGKSAADAVFVRYDKVGRFDKTGSGSVTVTLNASGAISLAYGGVSGSGYVVGVSRGGAGNNAGELQLSPGKLAYSSTPALYQVFANNSFGLQNQTLELTPGDGPGPTPPPQPVETVLKLSDDASAEIPLGFSFPFFGKSYTKVFANSDGNLSFGSGDSSTAPRDKARFLAGVPRIAALYRDLDPSAGGSVAYEAKDGTLTVRYQGVRLYGSTSTSTVAVTLHKDGLIELAYGQVAPGSYVVGVSRGGNGNSGTEQSLGKLAQPIGNGGTDTIFQVFSGSAPFDLGDKSIAFSLDGGVKPPPPPPTEYLLPLSDDGSMSVQLGFNFPFFGQTYASAWVNSDGNITFGKSDSSQSDRNETRFLTGAPRIALFFADLDPSAGGKVTYYHEDPASISVRFANVAQWGGGGTATATAKLTSSGAVTLTFGDQSASGGIIGVSKGGAGNNTAGIPLASLLQSSWSYSASGSVHAAYSGNDPFGLSGKSVTFSP